MGKKVYVTGGAGHMGGPCVLDLGAHLDEADISEMVIGDINLSKAQALASQIGDKRVRAEYIDVTAKDEAVGKLKGFDLLVNCCVFELFDNVVRIAIEAKADYTDIGGFPTEEHDMLAKKAGIRILPDAGLVCTVIVLLAKKAALLMDSVEQVHSYWCSFRSFAPSRGLLGSILLENAPVCELRNHFIAGRTINAAPFEGGKRVKLPDPVGEQEVYYMPHVETIMWARMFPEAKHISSMGCWRPDVQRDIKALNRLGLLDNEELDYKGQKINIYDFTRECIWRKIGGKVDRRYPWGYMYVIEVVGFKNGKVKTVLYNCPHPDDWWEESTAKMVGIPASVNAILILNKGRDKVGVFEPQDYYDMDDLEYLIKGFATRGIVITEEIREEPYKGFDDIVLELKE